MKYLSILFFIIIFSCCSIVKDPSTELITVVKTCIDSGEIKEKLVQVVKSDYGDYILYYINGSYEADITLSIDSILTPTKKIKYNKKVILFFELDKHKDKTSAVCVSENNIVNTGSSSVNWFYLVNKKTKEEFLIRNEDKETSPYDVSIIRDKITKRATKDTTPIDIVATNIRINCIEKLSYPTKAKCCFPYNIQVDFTIYDRTNSCYLFNSPLDSLGMFILLNKNDTLVIETAIDADRWYTEYKSIKKQKTKELIPGKYYSCDKNWDICGYYRGQSKNEEVFFNKIPRRHFQLDLYNMLKDSLFYIPNENTYNEYATRICNYSNKRIKIYFPIDNFYRFETPSSTYVYKKGILVWEW